MSANEAKKGMGVLEPSRPSGPVLDAGDYRAGDDAVERFRELLRIPTVSRDNKSFATMSLSAAGCPRCAGSSRASSR